jgi:hypothetical protein
MSRNKKSNIVDDTIYLFDYKNYWIEDTAQGHLIKICHGANDRILEIDCRWKKRKRDKSGRVTSDIRVETSKVLRRTKKSIKTSKLTKMIRSRRTVRTWLRTMKSKILNRK